MIKLLLALISLIGIVLAVSSPLVLHRTKRYEGDPHKKFNFDCRDRPIGFYADIEDCQYFHLCDNGVRITFSCSNETSFNQQYRVCDWDYNVDCQDSPNWYYLNDLTYATDEPKELF